MVLRIIKIILILSGAALLVYELSKNTKNYYWQALGVSLLMIGLFLVNTKIPHKQSIKDEENTEEGQEARG